MGFWRTFFSTLVTTLLLVTAPTAHAATVLFDGRTVAVPSTLPDATDLWVPVSELTRVNGFTLKPEGACLDDICVPVKRTAGSTIFVQRKGQEWFNVTELANRLQQPFVADYDADVWSFGAIPVQRQGLLRDALAPDFALVDWRGKEHQLSDFKGKKIMLLTWASW